ncbi:MAG: class I SAM-dependent rRNA methyltransferase [Lachnospiraceae bacterium]|nr:class I SAM-dependent rRNA methyltransferase [Lachnospiraceae bacterium]
MSAVVTLKKNEGRLLKAGGAWVFDNEIESIMGEYENGEVVVVKDNDGITLGQGFINENSKIRIRLLSRNADTEINRDFFRMRVKDAWNLRKSVMNADTEDNLNSLRIIFGEADFLPGLTVDKYNDVLVVQSLSLGIERFKETIIDELKAVLKEDGIDIKGVYERSDASVRKKEGMYLHKGFIGDEFDTMVPISENGVKYTVDVVNGQKTGFFLDQKYNRLAMQRLCKSVLNNSENLGGAGTLKVLDCFTHMGTFALNCALAGATDVTGLDISEFAVSQATENAKVNNLSDSAKFRCADVLDELPKLEKEGERFDIVILDPPAFTKSREATKNAIRGYREINMKGMKLVRDKGFFATCSCSHFMTEELFKQTILQAAKSAHKRLRQIEFRTQAPDHPILWAADESYYLKFIIFQVIEEK